MKITTTREGRIDAARQIIQRWTPQRARRLDELVQEITRTLRVVRAAQVLQKSDALEPQDLERATEAREHAEALKAITRVELYHVHATTAALERLVRIDVTKPRPQT